MGRRRETKVPKDPVSRNTRRIRNTGIEYKKGLPVIGKCAKIKFSPIRQTGGENRGKIWSKPIKTDVSGLF